ncbi:ARF GAP with effector function(s) [Cryptotrichosporon argae]
MSRQDKATTERNARILRDLVKQADNKACADCRKNDARWASWNLGVFLCIRCSGIHRSMGTHISRVKSIDLDIWQPEQMESMQKWGNRRANIYWEKHLKAGHVPPDHKIESFIRSKYESRRWAMEGPPPADPSVLESGGAATPPPVDQSSRPTPTKTTTAPPPAPASLPRAHPLLSRTAKAAPAAAPTPAATPLFDLMGDDAPTLAPAVTPAPHPTAAPAPAVPAATAAAAPPAPTAPASNIFDLDFRAPTPTAAKTNSKADIMSLFSTPSATSPPVPTAATGFGAGAGSFVGSDSAPATAPATTSPYASWQGGVTSSAAPQPFQQATAPIWGGADTAAWGGRAAQAQAPQPTQQAGGWGASVPAQPASNGWGAPEAGNNSVWGAGGAQADPWATPATTATTATTAAHMQAKKEDPFANIWQ